MDGRTISILRLSIVAGLVASLITACGVTERRVDPPAGTCSVGTEQGRTDCLRWAGFSQTSGLRVTAIHVDEGLDTILEFELRGAPDRIDAALKAAEFRTTLDPDVVPAQPATIGTPYRRLSGLHSGEGLSRAADGHEIYRVVVRGRPSGSREDEVLHVIAMTTP